MRKIWNAFKILTPAIPFILLKNTKTLEQQHHDLTPQIQTTVDRIFLTSEPSQFSDLKIFAFDAEILGKEVVSHLDTTLGRHSTSRFKDGQINIQILDAVRGHKVFILKSFENKNINDGIMELILAVSAMKKSGAASVTAIIPFFPYSTASSALHTDQINQGFDFHTCFAADIVKMLENSGCDEIITLNSQMTQPKGFALQSNFINIDTPQIVVPYLIRTKLQDPVLVGNKSNKRYLQNIHKLSKTFKVFDYNCDYGVFNNGEYIGKNVLGRDVVLYNNFIRTGLSLKRNVKSLKKMGARNIYCFGFHALCSNDLFDDLIKQLPIQQLIMTNTIFHANENKKIRMISVAKLLAQIITIKYDEKSLSQYRSEREMLNYVYLQKIKSINLEKKRIRKRMDQI